MMPYKSIYIKLFSVCMKKYMKEHRDGFYYYFTRCPINNFARRHGYLDVLPVCCELDHILTEASHGKLIRDYTLATGGSICDYWIVPDSIKAPR